MQPENCSCTWDPLEEGGYFMSVRDSNCASHGDSTPRWQRIVEHTRQLAASRDSATLTVTHGEEKV